MNQTLMETTRVMIAHAGLSDEYWGEAVAMAAYLRNRATSALKEDKTPYEKSNGMRENLISVI